LEYLTSPERVTAKRTRAAIDKLAALQFDGRGNRIGREARALLEHEHQRLAVGQVTVPVGICTEPSNVQAGGHACPFRFRCVGCGHFRSAPSYLPELRGYLDMLLRNRERVRAAVELEEWARAEAMPSDVEISRVRALIRRVETDLEQLSEEERGQVDEACRIVRATARPSTSVCPPSARPTSTPTSARTSRTSRDPARRDGHRGVGRGPPAGLDPPPPARHRRARPTHRRRRRDQRRGGRPPPGSTARSSTATTTCAPRSSSVRPRPSRTPRCRTPPRSAASRCWLTSPTSAHNERLRRQVTKLARRLSDALGGEVFRTSGLGAPPADEAEELRRRVAALEQTVLDLRQRLEERTEELDAARTTNRDLMAELNRLNRLPGQWPSADKPRKRTPRR
jgi:hypothetical protein